MKRAFAFLIPSMLLLAGMASAQYADGAAALHWSGSSGNTAGTFCWNPAFACSPHDVSVTANETITLTLRGDFLAPYAVGISTGASQCLVFPSVQNALLLDPPLTVLFSGALDRIGTIQACPPGTAEITVDFPMIVPPGTVFALQAFTLGVSDVPAFTDAIRVTVI